MAAAGAGGADSVDQTFDIDARRLDLAWGAVGAAPGAGPLELAQTFTVGRDGVLTRLDLGVVASACVGPGPVTAPLRWALRRTDAAGRPAGGLTEGSGSAVLAAGRFEPDGSICDDLRRTGHTRTAAGLAVPVGEGDVLAIVLRSDERVSRWSWHAAPVCGAVPGAPCMPDYEGGAAWVRVAGGPWTAFSELADDGRAVEFRFRTWVDSGPAGTSAAPGLWVLAALPLGLGAASAWRFRRRRAPGTDPSRAPATPPTGAPEVRR